MNKAEIDTIKQKWMVDMLEGIMSQPHRAPNESEMLENKFKFDALKDSPYIAEVIYPTSGDEFLTVRLMDTHKVDYHAEAEAVTVTSRRIATLERRGSDFKVYHDTDIRTGTVAIDLPIKDLRAVSTKDADLMMKMFHKIENAVDTGISWIL